MILFFPLFFVPCVLALSSSEMCDVKTVEGHLHLTGIHEINQYRKCQLEIFSPTSFIQFERYGGKKVDLNSWMNFTVVGQPNITISFGSNAIYFGSQSHISVPTTSALEQSMWLQIVQQPETLVVAYAHPGSIKLSKILQEKQSFKKPIVMISASTGSGMEQVVQAIQSEPDLQVGPVRVKTIMQLERRIFDLENEFSRMKDEYERKFILHRNQLGSHQEMHNNHYEDQSTGADEMSNLRTSLRLWGLLSVIIVFVGIYASWLTYLRHKKQDRWRL